MFINIVLFALALGYSLVIEGMEEARMSTLRRTEQPVVRENQPRNYPRVEHLEDEQSVESDSFYDVVQAVTAGDVDRVRNLVFDVNSRDYYDRPLIYNSILSGDEKVVNYLLEKGASTAVRFKGMTVLHAAVSCGSVPILKLLLEPKYCLARLIDEKDDFGNTPLIIAAKSGLLELVELLLLKAKADVGACNREGHNAFYYAQKNQHLKLVDVLMSDAQDDDWEWVIGRFLIAWITLDDQASAFQQLLIKACSENCMNLASYLIENDVTIESVDADGMTPLHWAAQSGYKNIVELLIKKGVDLEVLDKKECTPLMLAVRNGCKEVVSALLPQGANVDEYSRLLPQAARYGHEQVVLLLLDRGANINTKDGYWTALHCAALNGYKRVVTLLIKRKANINAATKEGDTPLHMAAVLGVLPDRIGIVRELLSHGALVSVKNASGITPLYHVVEWGNKEMVHLFIKKGADINARAKDGRTILCNAIWRGNKDAVTLLLANEVDIHQKGGRWDENALHVAARTGHVLFVALLIAKGADVNAPNNIGETALYMAVRSGHRDIAEMLVKAKANLNLVTKGRTTPLHLAATNAHKELTVMLLANGAHPNASDNSGKTPLHKVCWVSKKGAAEIVKILIDNGADPNKIDHNGQSSLHIAAERGTLEVVKILLAHGAVAQLKDKKGKTPGDLVNVGLFELLQLLREDKKKSANNIRVKK